MKRPLVSVRMIAWNNEKYIREAIESVLYQKVNFEYEILIADDASTDNTPKILAEYQERYPELITVFYRETNVGIQRNTDKLTCKCRGKYIAVLEGDDYWCDDTKLQRQIDYLETHSKVTATAHNVLCVDADGKPLPDELIDFPYQKEHVYGKTEALNCLQLGHLSSLVFRNFRDIMTAEQWKIYQKSTATDDMKMSVTLGMIGHLYYFENVWTCRRRVFEGTSYTARMICNNKNHTKDVCSNYLKLQQYMRIAYGEKADVTGYIKYMLDKNVLAIFEKGVSKQRIKDIKVCLISYIYAFVGRL